MPNWCHNNLRIVGSQEDLNILAAQLRHAVSPQQKLAARRVLFILVEDHFRGGELLNDNEFIKNKLIRLVTDNAIISEDLFNTVHHFWENLNLNRPRSTANQWDELWEKIRFDHTNSAISLESESFSDWVNSLKVPIKYSVDSDPFDFGAFVPKRLLSTMLGFNNQTEPVLCEFLSKLVIDEAPNEFNSNRIYWGSKWNVNKEELKSDFGEGYISLNFDTAWSPVSPVAASMMQTHPSLTFDYTFFEVSMDFCGRLIFKNGELLFAQEADKLTSVRNREEDEYDYEIVFPEWFEDDLENFIGGKTCH